MYILNPTPEARQLAAKRERGQGWAGSAWAGLVQAGGGGQQGRRMAQEEGDHQLQGQRTYDVHSGGGGIPQEELKVLMSCVRWEGFKNI